MRGMCRTHVLVAQTKPELRLGETISWCVWLPRFHSPRPPLSHGVLGQTKSLSFPPPSLFLCTVGLARTLCGNVCPVHCGFFSVMGGTSKEQSPSERKEETLDLTNQRRIPSQSEQEGENEKRRERGKEEVKSKEVLRGSRGRGAGMRPCVLYFSLKAPLKPQTHGAEFPLRVEVAGGRGNLLCKRTPPAVRHTHTHTDRRFYRWMQTLLEAGESVKEAGKHSETKGGRPQEEGRVRRELAGFTPWCVEMFPALAWNATQQCWRVIYC